MYSKHKALQTNKIVNKVIYAKFELRRQHLTALQCGKGLHFPTNWLQIIGAKEGGARKIKYDRYHERQDLATWYGRMSRAHISSWPNLWREVINLAERAARELERQVAH
eukprot:5629788-Amphidinium_carterae.1